MATNRMWGMAAADARPGPAQQRADGLGHASLRRVASVHGFTLIEVLVALAIVAIALLAVIALLSWRGLDSTIRGRDDITRNLSETRLLGRYLSQLQYDLLNVVTADEVFGPPLRIRPNELVLWAPFVICSLSPVRSLAAGADAAG